MAEKWCCEGVVLALQLPVTGTVTVNPATSILSNKVRTGGNRVYTKIGFTVTNATNGTCVQTAPVQGSIDGTAIKALIDSGEKPVRENDTATVTIAGLVGQSSCSFSATVEISYTGQIKVEGV